MARRSFAQKSSSLLSSPMFLIGGSLIFLILAWSAVNEYLRERSIDAEVDKLQAAIADLEIKNKELESSLSYFQTPEFQELEAKRQLGLTKEGESVIILSDNPTTSKTAIDGSAQTTSVSNPQKWLKYFFQN